MEEETQWLYTCQNLQRLKIVWSAAMGEGSFSYTWKPGQCLHIWSVVSEIAFFSSSTMSLFLCRASFDLIASSFYFIFFNVYLFLRERERETEHEQGACRERGRHRTRSRLRALSCQHRTRHGARTHKPWDHDLSWSRTLNQLSHPGSPVIFNEGKGSG